MSLKEHYSPERCLHQLFEEQVERTPDAAAVIFEGKQLSYRQLNDRANQLAHLLQRLGVRPDHLVAIFMDRSIEMVIALCAVLKAGGAYVPIDPEFPDERVAYMLSDSQVQIVLTQSFLNDRLAATASATRRVCVDDLNSGVLNESTENPPNLTQPGDLAYLIYTSGSTGRPKGAMNTHRGICNRLLWMQHEHPYNSNDAILQKTPFSFDVSIWEFFAPLLAGARLVVARPAGHKDPNYIIRLIVEQQITVVHFVPSMLRIFLEEDNVRECKSLRQVVCSGEALPLDLTVRYYERLEADLHNLYGPTETAVEVTHWICPRVPEGTTVPIGRPITNVQIYVLNENLQQVPTGEVGELCIGGVAVGRGYLNRPELTEERFIPDQFWEEPGAKLYRSGDLARYRPDGNLEYLGRIDGQVKIHGFRIELGEIEAVLQEQPGVSQCAVAMKTSDAGAKLLVAYVVANDASHPPDNAILLEALQRKLPAYAVPRLFVAMTSLPLTVSGKLDRRALPEPDLEATNNYVAPRNVTELQLAQIWSKVLGLSSVGVHDDFFEIGGHSLLAVRLVSVIRQSFGRTIPLPVLFKNPTIEGVAAILDAEHHAPQHDSALMLGPGKMPGTIFFVDAEIGLCRLSDLLADGPASIVTMAPFSEAALESAMQRNKAELPSLEFLAQAHTRLIKDYRRPGGPLVIVGHSFGGLIAFEAAHKLAREGIEVDLIVLVDTWVRMPTLWEKLPILTPELARRSIKIRTKAAVQKISGLFGKRNTEVSDNPAIAPVDETESFASLREYIHDNARDRYRPQPLNSRAILFRSSDPMYRHYHAVDKTLGWSGLFKRGFEIIESEGDHFTVLKAPHLEKVAAQTMERLSTLVLTGQETKA